MSHYSKITKQLDRMEKLDDANKKGNKYYNLRRMLSYTWASFYILIGGRGAGKTFSVQDYFLYEWKTKNKMFTWLRLTEPAKQNLLMNNAMSFIPPKLVRAYDLELTVKGNAVYDHGKLMCRILSLSTFYSSKGVALYDDTKHLGFNICLDEMNREIGEKKTFDINYAFAQQMENLVRKEKKHIRIFMLGNTLQEASDLMCSFEYVPEEFGIYKIKKKKAVVHYMENTERFNEMTKDSIMQILTPTSSNITNKINVDKSLLYKKRLIKPTYIIRFSETEAYTVWDGSIVAQYNNERVNTVPMYAYLNHIFNTDARDAVIEMFHNRAFLYRNLITQKMFKKALEQLKPRG